MTSKWRNRALGVALASSTLLTGFAAGWLASRRVVLAPVKTAQSVILLPRGDAPEAVRGDVLRTMRDFQDGYARRDVNAIGAFMQRLFPPGKVDLVLGTDGGEWIRGYEPIGQFIRGDWQFWGDVRLEVDDSMISAAGDAAWLATHGVVSFPGGSSRRIRFTATLVRDDRRWVFRQVQFQWERNDDVPSFREVFQPSTLVRLRWR
jgi:SnoaL-like domain